MNVKPPTDDELRYIAAEYHLDLSDADVESFQGLISGSLPAYERIHGLVEPKPPVKYPRTPGYRPQPEDNPLNAWHYKTSIKGAPSGPLSGKTVVTRILDAGGEIVGKAECESLCFSGGSYTNEDVDWAGL